MIILGSEPRPSVARVVSLVPSLTESVLRLGATVVGRTSFCPGDGGHLVGGPRDATAGSVLGLNPDLVLASRGENPPELVEAVASSCSVWLCEPTAPEEASDIWRQLGWLLGRGPQAESMAQEVTRAVADARAARERLGPGPRFVCWVWRDPWLAAGTHTWISGLLESAGFQNAVSERGYPEVGEPGSLPVDVHLLPSEPYAFGPADVDGLGGGAALATPGWYQLTGGGLATLVAGEPLIWYPSHTVEGLRLARDLRALVERG